MNSQLFIYPETNLNIPTNFSNGWNNWLPDNVINWTYTSSNEAKVLVNTSSKITYNDYDFLDGKVYKCKYKISNALSDTTHFIVTDSSSSKINTGNGTFTVTITNKSGSQSGLKIYLQTNVVANITISNIEVYEVIESEIELYGDTTFALNYNIADISDISKRSTSFSKTIVLPGTPNNNKIFNHVYRVNADNSFRINSPVYCILYNESQQIFAGDMYLNNIVLDEMDFNINYEIDLRSSVNTLFKVTSEKYLRTDPFSIDDLDFSEWNHALTFSNIKSSWWKGSELRTYTHAGLPTKPTTNYNLGEGYVYPLINYGYISEDIRVEDMRPALFIKEIWDKILRNAGFTYTSTFLNTDRFKRLVMPRTTEVTAGSATDQAEVVAQRTYVLRQDAYADNSLQINHTNWNQLTSISKPIVGLEFMATFTGKYNVRVDVGALKFMYALTNDEALNVHFRDAGSYNTNYSYMATFVFQLERLQGSQWTPIGTPQYIQPKMLSATPQLTMFKYTRNPWSYMNADSLATIDESNIDLTAGQKIRVVMTLDSPHKDSVGKWNYRKNDNNGADALCVVRTDMSNVVMTVVGDGGAKLAENDTVKMNYCLPLNVKQSDFLLSIIKTFNLFIDIDPNDKNNLIIENRDDFYNGGKIVDWTQKRDYMKDFKIEEASDLNMKNILFSWKEDTDRYNKDFQQYGEKDLNVYGHNFIKAERNTDVTMKPTDGVIFAATPMAQFPGYSNYRNIVTPCIYTYDDKSGFKSGQFKPRMLYWAGITYWDENNYLGTGAKWTLTSLADGTKLYTTSNITGWYPFAGHSDLAPIWNQTPTFDLNFGNNYWYYWEPTAGSYTYNNIVSTYHEKMLREYTDNESKKVTTYIWLSANDLYNLSFKDYYIIDNVYYRLNKIFDYTPGQVTKVELLRIINQDLPIVPPKGNKWNWYRGDYEGRKGWITPEYNGYFKGTNHIESYEQPYNFIQGEYNSVYYGAKYNNITGQRNIISANVSYSSVNGNNNYIAPNLTRVNIVNTDNLSVYESNVSYVNGIKHEGGVVIPHFDTAGGSLNEIGNPTGPSTINVIDGGKNTIREYGSFSPVNIINRNI